MRQRQLHAFSQTDCVAMCTVLGMLEAHCLGSNGEIKPRHKCEILQEVRSGSTMLLPIRRSHHTIRGASVTDGRHFMFAHLCREAHVDNQRKKAPYFNRLWIPFGTKQLAIRNGHSRKDGNGIKRWLRYVMTFEVCWGVVPNRWSGRGCHDDFTVVRIAR